MRAKSNPIFRSNALADALFRRLGTEAIIVGLRVVAGSGILVSSTFLFWCFMSLGLPLSLRCECLIKTICLLVNWPKARRRASARRESYMPRSAN